MPFLLDETAATGILFGVLLGGLMVGSYFFLQIGVRHFVAHAPTGWSKAGRFALLLLLTVALDFLLFVLLIRSF